MSYRVIEQQGRKYTLVPQDEWESLLDHLEELEDIRDLKQALKKAGETFPATLVNRILEGESEIRVFREYRQLTQQALADQVGITRNYLSLLESKQRVGTKKVLAAIAQALSVSLDDLI